MKGLLRAVGSGRTVGLFLAHVAPQNIIPQRVPLFYEDRIKIIGPFCHHAVAVSAYTKGQFYKLKALRSIRHIQTVLIFIDSE